MNDGDDNDDDDDYEWWQWWWLWLWMMTMMKMNLSSCPWSGGAGVRMSRNSYLGEQPLHINHSHINHWTTIAHLHSNYCTATTAQPLHNHNALNSTVHLIGVVHWVPCSVMHIYMNRSTRTMPHLGWWQERDCSRTLSESVPVTTEHIWAHVHLSSYSFELLLIWGSMMRWAHESWQLQNATVWKRRDSDTAKAKVDQSNADDFW